MANIYEEKNEALYLFLDAAKNDDGATVLIPDLQRPYVWTPNQVSLLVDSLIRGWPFGTLLVWKVSQQELKGIPHRQFWRLIDRRENGSGDTINRMDPPAKYKMVLDGQQRIQSLLLAFGGDAWGFKLEDREWAQEIQGRFPKGRQGRYKHWSKASLCFDLDAFEQEYMSGDKNLLSVDFRNVLKWAVTDPNEGQSKEQKPSNYVNPLPLAYSTENKGRYIRLSRLWTAATENPNIRETQFQKIITEMFENEEVPSDKKASLIVAMGELMSILRDVKLSKVTFLELLPFDPNIWTEDSYNDAIVNIFTRLNSAGRTLTREEITLAWLKVGWPSNANGGKGAGESFEELLEKMRSKGFKIEMDNLVSIVSFIWSVCCKEGQLLSNQDLLRGKTICRMASDLSERWMQIERSVLNGLDAVNSRELEFGSGGQYSSINSLAVVWAWLYIAYQWEEKQKFSELKKDDFNKIIWDTLVSFLDRWLICSQWAGRWAGSSASNTANYAKNLSSAFLECNEENNAENIFRVLKGRFFSFVKELEADATSTVNSLMAIGRERVSVYRTPLWIWHRLDSRRWEMSKIPLRLGKGKNKATLEVDHLVAVAIWKEKFEGENTEDDIDDNELFQVINMMGNCSLLEKSFNISKSERELASFMEQIHELKTGNLNLDSWAKELQVGPPLLKPKGAQKDEILESIRTRDSSIRAELTEFIKGARGRVDV